MTAPRPATRLTASEYQQSQRARKHPPHGPDAKKRKIGSGMYVRESHIVKSCLAYLNAHPRVAWAVRMNTGAFVIPGAHRPRFFRAAFKGCSDIIGQMKDGRFLACECKRLGKKPTNEQQAFLDTVNRHGGLGFVAHGILDCLAALRCIARKSLELRIVAWQK